MAHADPLSRFLWQLFRSHGVRASLQGEKVEFRKSHDSIQAQVVREAEHGNAFVVQLDIRFTFAPEDTIIESFVGFGATREAAIANAMESFMTGTFHVILATFFKPDDPQVRRETWTIDGVPRTVTLGDALYRGMGDAPPAQFDLGWLREFQQKVAGLKLSAEMHWLRIFYAQNARQTTQCEVLLDNHPWPTMQAEARSIAWPVSDEFLSVRLFLIIQDRSSMPQPVQT